ncbi:MAG TPA: OmpA family protein, partial [Polyangia bacterium]|nr:OmpA family protein [Polyangia bacterium]
EGGAGGQGQVSAANLLRPSLALALLLGLACATPPKPPELDAFEKLRADPSAAAAAKKSPDLVSKADRWLARSQEEWKGNDLEESVNSALMGQISLKQAMAIADQDRAKVRSASADAELERAKDEQYRLEKDLAALNDNLALLKRLQAQSAELGAEKKQLEVERQKGIAAEKIGDAELALKSADTVNAKKHAGGQYQAAVDLLARAQQEVQQGNFPAAQLSADMAKKKADEASEAAKPMYQEEAKSAESRAQADALARDMAAIAGVSNKRDIRGSLQRVVLVVPADLLFFRNETTIGAGKGGVLDQVAALIKKYGSFPVQVLGFTDSRGGAANALLARSMARAQSVYSALLTRGVEARRLTVSGYGSAEPIASPGRPANNRVEIVFVYQ